MDKECSNCTNCEEGASVCDTGEPCVLAFLKALQKRYFYHSYIPDKHEQPDTMKETLIAWEHRLGAINIPAEDFIATVQADALTMIVQHSRKAKDNCSLLWICGAKGECAHSPSDRNEEELVINRRLVLLEYPFLINFAAAKRIAGWSFDADEILNFYNTFSIENRIYVPSVVSCLIKSFCGFLDMLCNTEGENQKRIVMAIRSCIEILIKNLKDSGNRINKARIELKSYLCASPYFPEGDPSSGGTVNELLGEDCRLSLSQQFTEEPSTYEEEAKKLRRKIGEFSMYLILKYFVARD